MVARYSKSKIKNILSSELALLNQEEILMEKENQEEIMEINETIYEDELLDDDSAKELAFPDKTEVDA